MFLGIYVYIYEVIIYGAVSRNHYFFTYMVHYYLDTFHCYSTKNLVFIFLKFYLANKIFEGRSMKHVLQVVSKSNFMQLSVKTPTRVWLCFSHMPHAHFQMNSWLQLRGDHPVPHDLLHPHPGFFRFGWYALLRKIFTIYINGHVVSHFSYDMTMKACTPRLPVLGFMKCRDWLTVLQMQPK